MAGDPDAAQGHIPALTPAAAAHRLGVAVGTLRSWDRRYGLGPRGHTTGAHRRYTPEDLHRLEELCRLVGEGVPVAEAARALAEPTEENHSGDPVSTRLPAARRDAGAAARGLTRAAVRLDAPRVLDLLAAALDLHGVIDAWQRVISPALAAVGRKWTETDGRYVEVEHLLSWCTAVALYRVAPAPPRRCRPADRGVVLACAPGEWHSLPLDVLTAALGERGVAVRMFGAAVPADALYQAIDRVRPRCAVLWSQVPKTADHVLLDAVAALPGVAAFAAGPGWSRPVQPPATAVASLEQALSVCLGHCDDTAGRA